MDGYLCTYRAPNNKDVRMLDMTHTDINTAHDRITFSYLMSVLLTLMFQCPSVHVVLLHRGRIVALQAPIFPAI